MKIEKSFSALCMLVTAMLAFSVHAEELKSDEDAEFKELIAKGKLDSEGFQIVKYLMEVMLKLNPTQDCAQLKSFNKMKWLSMKLLD